MVSHQLLPTFRRRIASGVVSTKKKNVDIICNLFLSSIVLLLYCAKCSYCAGVDYQTENNTYTNATHLLKKLLTEYDIRLRPDFGENALLLEMDIVIASFDSISEVNMDYTITMYLNQYWCDKRLSWSELRNDSMTLSGEFAGQIWVPDTFLANDKHSFLHDVTETNKMLRLHGDGYIAYGMRFTTTLACNMNLRYYPLDSQNCTIEIESYGYTTDEVFMAWKDGDNSIKGVMEAEIPQFSILRYKTIVRTETTSTGLYQRLSLVLILRRNIGYFIFQTYLPSILIVMLSWVSFWINHEATSARVALGITTVLTMTTISTGVRASLPRISYIKAIDIYLVMCFVFVFAALLEYAAVNYTYWGSKTRRKGKDGRVMQRAATKEFPTWESFMTEKEQDETSEIEDSIRQHVVSNDSGGRASPLPGLRPLSSGIHDTTDYNLVLRTATADSGSSPANQESAATGGSFPRSSLYSPSESAYPGLRYRGRGKHGGAVGTARRKKFVKSLRQRARAVRMVIPKIRDINVIDKWSRFVFPSSFVLFNIVYWCYYIFVDWDGPPDQAAA